MTFSLTTDQIATIVFIIGIVGIVATYCNLNGNAVVSPYEGLILTIIGMLGAGYIAKTYA